MKRPPEDFKETQVGTLWSHKKTGGIYVVFGFCQIEATNEPGVLYHSTAGQEPLWCRSLAEFLDGRFQPAEAVPAATQEQSHD
jgi:hypothetical protein